MALTKSGPVFGLSSVYVKGITDAAGSWVRIPSVQDAQYKGSVTEVELTGDNAILGVLRHSQKGVITVKASQVAMAVLEKVSGNTGVGAGSSVESLAFGTLAELTPPGIAVKANIPVSRADGTFGTVVTFWYQCQVSTAFEAFPGGSYGQVTPMSLTISAYHATNDENGFALNGDGRGPATGAFGRVEFHDGVQLT